MSQTETDPVAFSASDTNTVEMPQPACPRAIRKTEVRSPTTSFGRPISPLRPRTKCTGPRAEGTKAPAQVRWVRPFSPRL